jgi:hypothetical protein
VDGRGNRTIFGRAAVIRESAIAAIYRPLVVL